MAGYGFWTVQRTRRTFPDELVWGCADSNYHCWSTLNITLNISFQKLHVQPRRHFWVKYFQPDSLYLWSRIGSTFPNPSLSTIWIGHDNILPHTVAHGSEWSRQLTAVPRSAGVVAPGWTTCHFDPCWVLVVMCACLIYFFPVCQNIHHGNVSIAKFVSTQIVTPMTKPVQCPALNCLGL